MSLFDVKKIPDAGKEPRCQSESLETKAARHLMMAGKRFERCQEVIGSGFDMGSSIHYVSAAEWSSHDLLFHLLNKTGSADVWIASWSISEDPCRQLIRAMDREAIRSLHLLFDWRVKIRCPEAAHLAQHNASSCHLASCHAKVTVIINRDWQIAVVGSANYTNNPRIEAGTIIFDDEVASFHRQWIEKTIKRADPFEMEKKHARKR